jgi:class 3 adenylate cyclase
MSTTPAEPRATRELLIVFADLSFYTQDARRTNDDARVADIIDAYYERLSDGTRAAGGQVVKFIGDGALIVFPPERADAAVSALLDMKQEIDLWLQTERWDSRLVVKAHAGTVVASDFGGKGDKRFDVIGDEVNVTARLQTRGLAISAQAFRLLSPDLRKRFKKHTPPILYIPVEDRRPSNVAKWP